MTTTQASARKRRVATKATPADIVADRILKAIRRILQRSAEHSRYLQKEAGLTATQLLCLRVIGEADSQDQLTAAMLAETLQLTPPTASRILDRLEKLQLIKRERATTDRRKVRLQMTRSGRARLRKLPLPLQERFLQQLDALPDRKRQRLLASLETIVEMMGAGDLEVAPILTSGVDDKGNH